MKGGTFYRSADINSVIFLKFNHVVNAPSPYGMSRTGRWNHKSPRVQILLLESLR